VGERFFDASHVRQKLNHTICMYKGSPVYVDHVGGDTIQVFPVGGTPTPFNIEYTDPEFDYSEIPLGYCTYRNKAYYLAREPQRINSQGLTMRAILSEPVFDKNHQDLMFSKAFKDCILGNHPTYERALAKIADSHESCAVSRTVALQRVARGTYMALHRGRAVAISENKGRSFHPMESQASSLIRKRLEKAGIPLD
jgi:hypothetical protein